MWFFINIFITQIKMYSAKIDFSNISKHATRIFMKIVYNHPESLSLTSVISEIRMFGLFKKRFKQLHARYDARPLTLNHLIFLANMKLQTYFRREIFRMFLFSNHKSLTFFTSRKTFLYFWKTLASFVFLSKWFNIFFHISRVSVIFFVGRDWII